MCTAATRSLSRFRRRGPGYWHDSRAGRQKRIFSSRVASLTACNLIRDAFVAVVVIGGSVVGFGRYLRSRNHAVRIQPDEPDESPLGAATSDGCGVAALSRRSRGVEALRSPGAHDHSAVAASANSYDHLREGTGMTVTIAPKSNAGGVGCECRRKLCVCLISSTGLPQTNGCFLLKGDQDVLSRRRVCHRLRPVCLAP